MPTIDIDYQELQNLIGTPLNKDMEKLDDILSYIKAEVKQYNPAEGTVNIEFKDTNRPDLWSVEGLTRALQGYLGNRKGIKPYRLGEPTIEVHVDQRLSTIRPFICCSIVKNVPLTDAIIRGLMHLQDKLDKTYGRSRQKTSIGIYDFDQITPPLNYTVAKPNEFRFIPLGFSEKMTLAEMLERHPKGLEYGHIVKKHPVYPILLDNEQKVLSFPPIINSNDLGRITETAHNLLVEVTGTFHHTVLNTLNLVTLALVDRGGKAHAATIHYPQDPIYPARTVTTPSFGNRKVNLSVEYTNRLLGLNLKWEEIAALLSTAGFNTGKADEAKLEVFVPCYRIDIMHQVDLIEDVAIAYGYNNIKPVWQDLPTTGQPRPQQRLVNVARELMIGLGYQEITTYTLTNPENLFTKMNRPPIEVVEIANPKLVTMTCLRNWLLPSTIEFLSNNESTEFPQRIFELGKVTLLDETRETRTRDEEWLSAATTHMNAGFSEIKSALDAFFTNLGVAWQIQETKHPTFIEGRTGAVLVNGENVGVVGEVSPQVLSEWKLENPIAAFEVNLQRILEQRK
jgi:phenylalanyl-tRNA synthetase beta chain